MCRIFLLQTSLIRGKLAARLLGRKKGLAGRFGKWTIDIANNWHSNINSEIKQIRSVHPGWRQSLYFLVKSPQEQLHMLISNILNTPFLLPLSISKLHCLNKGQLRTLFAKLAHCSFETLGVLGFGDFLTSFHPLWPKLRKSRDKNFFPIFKMNPTHC